MIYQFFLGYHERMPEVCRLLEENMIGYFDNHFKNPKLARASSYEPQINYYIRLSGDYKIVLFGLLVDCEKVGDRIEVLEPTIEAVRGFIRNLTQNTKL